MAGRASRGPELGAGRGGAPGCSLVIKPRGHPRVLARSAGRRPRDGMLVGAVVAGTVAVGAVPVVLGTLGFTAAGIAAGSVAAKMMSAAAVANAGGVVAGSLVATLQSVGAAGLATSSNVILGTVGSALGALAMI
ncbi:interferon alpha-inducible protein 27-like protein 2A isoform X1 [Oryctolagus cuniculus]|uniref:interferon alpha-inducible protein 27-like protein 2A isoform X1 n=1 Tax=Oryctolagus cuniculus TaxID=9986 RepID=UPI0038793531